jgi:hypothetical protein
MSEEIYERHVDRSSSRIRPVQNPPQGHLDPRWAASFDGMSLINESDGISVIRGPVRDQAALHGLLQKLRDLNLPLVSVTQVEPDLPAAPPVNPR